MVAANACVLLLRPCRPIRGNISPSHRLPRSIPLQLGFNAVFSLFLNHQKFTPYIINSLVLLTISSTLLVFDPDTGGSSKISKRKYMIGFVCTLAASAGYAIMLSLTQLAFQKLIKRETTRAIVDMTIYQNLVATVVTVIGLFAAGGLDGELDLGQDVGGSKKRWSEVELEIEF